MDVMLDLETWGTRPGCAIASVGAVLFNPRGTELENGFYQNISLESCQEAALRIDAETVGWWLQQDEAARVALAVNPRPLRDALADFSDWFQNNQAVCVWSHGANFDEPIIVTAMKAVGIKPPWKFSNSRCTRTLYDAFNFDPRSLAREGTHHNALDDATYQARCVQAAFAKLPNTYLAPAL